MPLQRRLPKRGFLAVTITKAAEVRMGDLARVDGEVNLDGLKKAGLVPTDAKRAKIILSGSLDKAVKVSGISASKGAKAAIEKAGGSVAPVVIEPPKHAKKPRAEQAAAAK
jgi:large subunit ribosomal protein L15